MKNLMEKINLFLLNEVEWKRVIRKGKLQKKLICPPGYKAKDNKCIRMEPSEMIKRKRSAIKSQRLLHSNPGKETKLLKKRRKSLRRRLTMIHDKESE
jgi:hypothetical protein